jgi:hypothetical protein
MTTAQACCSCAIRDEFPAALAKVSAEARGPTARWPAATGFIASDAKMATVEIAKDKLFIGNLQRCQGSYRLVETAPMIGKSGAAHEGAAPE